jgi:predicted secreted protein
MHWVVLAGAYVILWFLTLQILLPIGIGAPHESGEATPNVADAGAPGNPRLVLKALIATFAAAAIWLVFYGLILAHVIDL